MRLTSVILLILVASLVHSQSDPSNQNDNDNDNTDAQQIKILNEVDMYAFLIVCPICFFMILAITIVYLANPRTRQMPNDIMMALSMCDMALLCDWFTVSLYSLLKRNHDSLANTSAFEKFCSFEATISILASAGEFVYNCIFCIFLLIQIRIGIKGKITWFRALLYHSVAIVIIIFVLIFVQATQIKIYGLCKYKVESTYEYIELALVFLYLCLASYTVFTFKRQIPDDPAFKKYRDGFLAYYSKYIKWTVVVWTLLTISNLALTIQNSVFKDEDILNILRTMNNLIKLAVPIILAVIRYINPAIKPTINRFLRKKLCCCCFPPKKAPEDYQSMNVHRTQTSDFSELELNWFDGLSSSIRLSQLYTILIGLHKNFGKRKNIQTSSETSQNFSSDLQNEFAIQQITLEDMTKQHPSKATVIPMAMHVYCPTIFQEFIAHDGLTVEQVFQSLKPELSLKLIDQTSNDGGASGQFFLFSHDNRVLIKTILEEELQVYMKRIKHFSEYYSKNPKSLITKFYGIFSFQCVQFKAPKIHLLLTRNLTQVNKKKLRGIYDLKGSTYNRKVLKENRLTMSLKVLKDLDFDNIQRRVWGKQEDIKEIKQALVKDSEFFKQVGLMDYSLIIAKVDIQSDEIVPIYHGQIWSTKQPEILYRVGIVDYLQLWNAKKIIEKTTKQIVNMSAKLDTSAQDPKKYSKRFIVLLEKIFPTSDSLPIPNSQIQQSA